MTNPNIKPSILGFTTADALGVPHEFKDRQRLQNFPVTDMTAYGTHNQPMGTWSDDSSLTFCIMESLCKGYNLHNIAQKFMAWLYEEHWTPHGNVFDVGMATREALENLKSGIDPTESGPDSEYDNGNGSLMRILPLVFYLQGAEKKEKISIIHQVSSITHAHPRSLIACTLYVTLGQNINNGMHLQQAYAKTIDEITEYYTHSPYKEELPHFSTILSGTIHTKEAAEIQSSGYVVHSLETSLWCLLTTDNYVDSVLKAVNLGEDTDTNAALVGGLAGICYGMNSIPKKWLETLARKQDIEVLIKDFSEACINRGTIAQQQNLHRD